MGEHGGFEALVRPGMSLKVFGKKEMIFESIGQNWLSATSLEIHQPNMHVEIVLPFINNHSMTLAILSQGFDPNSLGCNVNVAGCSDEE